MGSEEEVSTSSLFLSPSPSWGASPTRNPGVGPRILPPPPRCCEIWGRLAPSPPRLETFYLSVQFVPFQFSSEATTTTKGGKKIREGKKNPKFPKFWKRRGGNSSVKFKGKANFRCPPPRGLLQPAQRILVHGKELPKAKFKGTEPKRSPRERRE